jgi:hypothetical protein
MEILVPETVQELGDRSIESKLDVDFWVKEFFKEIS